MDFLNKDESSVLVKLQKRRKIKGFEPMLTSPKNHSVKKNLLLEGCEMFLRNISFFYFAEKHYH